MSDYIARCAASALGVPISQIDVRLRPPRGYQTHTLFDVLAPGQHLIAKQFKEQIDQTDCALREFRGLQLAAPLGVAPRPVFFDDDSLVLYEFMPGEVWDRRAATPDDMHQLAGAWVRMGNLPAQEVWPSTLTLHLQDPSEKLFEIEPYASVAAQNPATARAAAVCRQAMRLAVEANREFHRHKPVLRFCKCDPRFGNVLARPGGGIGMIDWEDCGLQDPALEIADVFTAPNQEDLLSAQAKAAFWDGLREWQDDDLPRRVRLAEVALLGTWLHVLLARVGLRRLADGTLDGWEVNEMPYAMRLRRMLARMFDPDVDGALAEFAALEFF